MRGAVCHAHILDVKGNRAQPSEVVNTEKEHRGADRGRKQTRRGDRGGDRVLVEHGGSETRMFVRFSRGSRWILVFSSQIRPYNTPT